MTQRATSSIRSLRQLRTRTVLLAGAVVVALVYFTSAYYHLNVVAEHADWIPTTPGQASSQAADEADVQRRSACWEQWFSKGTVCVRPPKQWTEQAKLDLVWTWSNSSLTPQAHDRIDPARASSSHSHAEASDFLRYSFRSAQQHMHHGFGRVTLLTPDLPKDKLATPALEACTRSYSDAQGVSRNGQRPCWLATEDRVFEAPQLLHNRQVGCSPGSLATSCSGHWIDQDEPYSSALLAAQAPGLSDVRLLVAPHHVFARPVSASDFWSPLYGATYRFDPEVPSAGASPTAGEEALQKPNALLDARFGARPRRKLRDLPVPVSASILAEMRHIWPDVLRLTPEAKSTTFDFGFLAAHYVLERHREALLWSFMVAKHDRDADGVFSAAEAEALLKDLNIDAHRAYAAPQVEVPRRGTRSAATVASNLRRAQMPERLGKESMMSSMDGLAFLIPRSSDAQEGAAAEEAQPPVCRLERECVKPLLDAVTGSDRPRVSEVLRRVAFQAPMCGDCMLTHLVGQSGEQGLSAFLPAAELEMPVIEVLPLTARFEQADHSLAGSGLARTTRLHGVTQLLARYAHTVVQQQSFVTPAMSTLSQTRLGLITLEVLESSSLFSFKQQLNASEPLELATQTEWDWTAYVRAWLSLRFPFAMRFESRTHEL
ncbi:uncharacterized protein PAN0_015d5185 [Moesziomyces antarcticus]|uniref:Uncharacterized protein n=2 Tax=Pseudozyma antarctica TaxID=84753 RepID=A0A5C3FUN0_PSEA2|nr:uncharacterized protein PAN0_015d5185 [Moesziomyces antarcticus]GAK66960.1 conserved hypothetical protein [Moesziomyces antarcticus]SPO48012.1 uncharacterized protein PSANT_05700 [Moesziomyces antarcticus]